MDDLHEIVHHLSWRYPQLLLPIAAGMSSSEQYKSAVLRGRFPDADPVISGSALDFYEETATAFGTIGIWKLENRDDFVRALQALVYRCEPVEIPETVGAQYIGGLINWEKIYAHRMQYLAAGGKDWGAEFRRFTADKENYTDSLIVLSSGAYSNVPAWEVRMTDQEWKNASYLIRKKHELTHFIYRKAYPGDIDVIRDEVLADCMGLLAAFGCYNPALARRFLGIGDEGLLPDARLRHYVKEEELDAAVRKACFWIDALSQILIFRRDSL